MCSKGGFFFGFSTSNLLTKYFSKSDNEINIQKKCISTMIYFENMHNPLIILNVRIHASQMLNILLNGTPTVSSSIITKQSVYTRNL